MIKELMKIRDRKASDAETQGEGHNEHNDNDDIEGGENTEADAGGENTTDDELEGDAGARVKFKPKPRKGIAELDKMILEISMISDLPEVDHKELDESVKSRLLNVQTHARSHRNWKSQFLQKKKSLFERSKNLNENRMAHMNALKEEALLARSRIKQAELLREKDAELAAIQKEIAVKEAETRLNLKYREASVVEATDRGEVLKIYTETDDTGNANLDDNSKINEATKPKIENRDKSSAKDWNDSATENLKTVT